MSWRPEQYLEKLYYSTIPKYSFCAQDEVQWKQWRDNLKETFINALGGFPKKKVELNSRLLEEEELRDHIRQRVVFTSMENLEVPSYVLIPKNRTGKLPAVIACHGHGYGSKDIVGLDFDGNVKTGDIGYQKNFALELVKRGFLVIAPELLGFGDRTLQEDAQGARKGESSCFRISANLLMMGKTMAGIRVWEILRTIDYLATRREVDADRIGCMGISGGGLVCAFASAVDERIKVSVISGYVNTFKDSIMAMYHCIDNFIPGILMHAELPDIVGMIAPRPLLVESGTQDGIFPMDATMEAFSKLEAIYWLLGKKDRIEKDFFQGGHQISGEKAYDWFVKWL